MMNIIKQLFGLAPKVDYKELVRKGATILDVRTRGEFQGGHIKGSINIPVDALGDHLNKLKKDQPVITCCASGMRSASAKRILLTNGFNNVHNGGGWNRLAAKLGLPVA